MPKTIVRGIRIDKRLWGELEKIANAKEKSRNEIVVGLISQYCDKNSKAIVDNGKKM
jgi:metal-responsive CopG/Arc/MetJ family transcriptional regulator